MESKLVENCFYALKHNLGARGSDSILVLYDSLSRRLGQVFGEAARKISTQVTLLEVPLLPHNGSEPGPEAAARMLRHNIVLAPLSRSISWTKARKAATDGGTRVATMPGITEDIILRTFSADYLRIRRLVNLLCDRLDRCRQIRVTTTRGTELNFSVQGRAGRGRNGGIYRESGAWGNLPCGEAFISPVEGSTKGVYVVDASHAGIGTVRSPLSVQVEKGKAVRFNGGDALRLEALIHGVENERARNIAEFGIGCHHLARVTGITLEDEKSLGTCHIALGSSVYFGGTVDAGIHLDGVIHSPTIYLDDVAIMTEGKLSHELSHY